jgi:hypothetical protein
MARAIPALPASANIDDEWLDVGQVAKAAIVRTSTFTWINC